MRIRFSSGSPPRRKSVNFRRIPFTAYRRTWLRLFAWAAAEGLALETLPSDGAGEFYEEAAGGRSASHHLQVKAALSLLYRVLGSTNPFAECPTPKFAPQKTELERVTARAAIGEAVNRQTRVIYVHT
jgi:hypothetical protein